jgi:hypothetical protein
MERRRNTHLTLIINIISALLLISIIINIILSAKFRAVKETYVQAFDNYTVKAKELDSKIDMKDSELDKLFDSYYTDKLLSFIDEKDLLLLAQKQWNYALTVNGKIFNTGIFNSEDKNIKIILAETKSNENFLPEQILVKGNLLGGDTNDSLYSHFKVHSISKYTIYEESDGNNKRICCEFKDLPSGSLITILISDILKYRLNLNDKLKEDDYKLQIVVK